VRITRIGRIEAGTGLRVVDAGGQPIPPQATGYRHF
jgi:thiamine monophosphate kinase